MVVGFPSDFYVCARVCVCACVKSEEEEARGPRLDESCSRCVTHRSRLMNVRLIGAGKTAELLKVVAHCLRAKIVALNGRI